MAQLPNPYASALPYVTQHGRPGIPMVYDPAAAAYYSGSAVPTAPVMGSPYMHPAQLHAYTPTYGSTVIAPPPAKKDVVTMKESAVYFNDTAGWKKLFATLKSDGQLAFYDRQDKKEQDKLVTLTSSTVVRMEDGYIAVDVPGESKFYLNAINQGVLKEWLASLNDVVKLLKEAQYQFVAYQYHAPHPGSPLSYRSAAVAMPNQAPAASYASVPSPSAPAESDATQSAVPVPPLPAHIKSKRRSEGSHSPRENKGTSDAPTTVSSAPASDPFPVAALPAAHLGRRGSLGKDAKLLPSAHPNLSTSASASTDKPSATSTDDEPPQPSGAEQSNKQANEIESLKEEIEKLKQANLELTRKLEQARKDATPPRTSSASDLIAKASVEYSAPETGIHIDVKRDTVEFHERLGGGGSGANVYRCTIKGFSFAAKVMDLNYAQAADIEPMMKEIAIMTGLQHDNIVKYIGSDCNMVKKEVRLFIELYSGTLRDVIESRSAQGRRLTKREIVDWSFQVAKGLHYLHSKNIIHRDLKSDNVFVTWDGQKNPKSMHIGDFDVSKLVEKGKVSFTQNIGTPGFIAPEIMSQGGQAGGQTYGFEADIWSFGMLLYELLTLKRPYFDVAPLQVSETNAQGVRPTLPAEVDEHEFKELIKLFKQCTNKKATQRPSSKKLISSLSKI